MSDSGIREFPERSEEPALTDERGDMNIEAAILTGALLLLLALMWMGGQVITAENAVAEAARAAARSASITGDAGTARSRAEETLARQLQCADTAVDVDTSGFSAPAGTPAVVTASVTCRVAFGSLVVPGAPGSHTVTATFTSPVDRYGSLRGGAVP